ncbi:MAG: hypothetical protein HQ541_20695 [Mariniphaga sp.]|nr:hypothetical protein [Mariniphaga sp.]
MNTLIQKTSKEFQDETAAELAVTPNKKLNQVPDEQLNALGKVMKEYLPEQKTEDLVIVPGRF